MGRSHEPGCGAVSRPPHRLDRRSPLKRIEFSARVGWRGKFALGEARQVTS